MDDLAGWYRYGRVSVLPHTQTSTRPYLPLGLILVLALFVAGPAVGQEESGRRFLRWAYQDAGALAWQAGTRTPLLALGGAAVLVPAAQLDRPLLQEVQEGYRGPLAAYLDATNELGGRRVLPVMAGVFFVSLATYDTRFQDAAFTSFQAIVYAGTFTGTLKSLVGRFRPEVGSGAFRFDPFSGHMSFPSGHTTAAFALITPWVLYYPHPVTYGLFALSLGTATARIALDKHWPTDVMAGAAIGFFTARFLTRRHQHAQRPAPQPSAPRLDVRPVLAQGGSGLLLRLRLD